MQLFKLKSLLLSSYNCVATSLKFKEQIKHILTSIPIVHFPLAIAVHGIQNTRAVQRCFHTGSSAFSTPVRNICTVRIPEFKLGA
jgi:hypothetical protein